MPECTNEQYERVCKREFQKIHTKLDRIDAAIRGNGAPGIQIRLDRLEGAEKRRSKLFWILSTAVVSLTVTTIWRLVIGG